MANSSGGQSKDKNKAEEVESKLHMYLTSYMLAYTYIIYIHI